MIFYQNKLISNLFTQHYIYRIIIHSKSRIAQLIYTTTTTMTEWFYEGKKTKERGVDGWMEHDQKMTKVDEVATTQRRGRGPETGTGEERMGDTCSADSDRGGRR